MGSPCARSTTRPAARTEESLKVMLLADSIAWLALILAMLVAIVILLRRSYRYFGRRSAREGPIAHVAKDTARWDPRPVDLSGELARQEVRMHETARELSAKLDSKIRVLQYLTSSAQQQIERLETLLEQAGAVAGPRRQQERPAAAGPEPAAAAARGHRTLDPCREKVYRLADSGLSIPSIAHQAGMSLDEIRAVLHERESGGSG